jgi:hypothetical protein
LVHRNYVESYYYYSYGILLILVCICFFLRNNVIFLSMSLFFCMSYSIVRCLINSSFSTNFSIYFSSSLPPLSPPFYVVLLSEKLQCLVLFFYYLCNFSKVSFLFYLSGRKWIVFLWYYS